jgi:tetratricopeptide (TPR) repeat protein
VETDPPDLAAAKAALAQADKINPLDTGTAFWKARVAMLEGRRDDAQKSMDVALRGEPNNAEYHYWSGRLYESFDSLFEAIKEYEKAVSLNSRHARAYRALGIAATARNQFEKARGHFEKYRAAAPHDQTVWVDIGLSYVRENRDPEALKIFEEVIARDPDQALVLVEIGAIIARRGDDAGALTYYKRAAKADPTFGDGWCQYGIVAALDSPSKPSKEAVAALTKCVELDNSSSDLKKTAQQALAQAGR